MRLAGEAHRQAELATLSQQQREVEQKHKALNDRMNQKARGSTALQKERQVLVEKRELEEQIKQIERKKKVFQQESSLAHDRAKEYRSTQDSQQ